MRKKEQTPKTQSKDKSIHTGLDKAKIKQVGESHWKKTMRRKNKALNFYFKIIKKNVELSYKSHSHDMHGNMDSTGACAVSLTDDTCSLSTDPTWFQHFMCDFMYARLLKVLHPPLSWLSWSRKEEQKKNKKLKTDNANQRRAFWGLETKPRTHSLLDPSQRSTHIQTCGFEVGYAHLMSMRIYDCIVYNELNANR